MVKRQPHEAEDYDFELELKRILRRAERLKAAMDGSATVQRVWVKKHRVREHEVSSHWRVLITRTKPAPATRSPKLRAKLGVVR